MAGNAQGQPVPPQPPGGDDLPVGGESEEEEEQDLEELDQAALLRMFVRNQQTQTRLMQMMQGGKGKGKVGGAEARAKPEPPPAFSGTQGGWEAWKLKIQEWEALNHHLDPTQKAPLLMKALAGEAASLARSAVHPQELNDEQAFQYIMDTLEENYGTRASIRRFREFNNLVNFRSNNRANLEGFMRAWQIKTHRAEREGLQLPDELKAFMLLSAARLDGPQAESALAQIEAAQAANENIGANQPLRLATVSSILRTMAQARQIRAVASDGRYRERLAMVTPSHENEDWPGSSGWDPADSGQHDDAEGWDEGDYDVEDDEDNYAFVAATEALEAEAEYYGDEEFTAALAAFKGRRKGARKGDKGSKGKPKGGKPFGAGRSGAPPKGPGKSQAPKAKGKVKPQRTRRCRFENNCNELREKNKLCGFEHTEEELKNAREHIREKGGVPTFVAPATEVIPIRCPVLNAFSNDESFEKLTRYLTKNSLHCISDTAAKKAVCGERYLALAKRHLRKFGKEVTLVQSAPNRAFQFGGGTKSSQGRYKVPFRLTYLARAGSNGEFAKVTEWRDIYVDVVKGWMPLLFALDSMTHHRINVDTEYCRLVHGRSFDQVVLGSGKDAYVGLITMNLLSSEHTTAEGSADTALVGRAFGSAGNASMLAGKLQRGDVRQGDQYLQPDETLEDSAAETDSDVEEMLEAVQASRLKRGYMSEAMVEVPTLVGGPALHEEDLLVGDTSAETEADVPVEIPSPVTHPEEVIPERETAEAE